MGNSEFCSNKIPQRWHLPFLTVNWAMIALATRLMLVFSRSSESGPPLWQSPDFTSVSSLGKATKLFPVDKERLEPVARQGLVTEGISSS
ncbi:hypothetical protein EK904_011160 [Melospiza melodia maxima]|nr:hypothetical protein EK904_011160 [Melospiza melodia maxima]